MLKCSLTTYILVMFLVLTLLLEQTRKVSLFGVFVGFNQFRETVVFGVVLRYDETYESFKWLFETFLKAHNGKQPKTINTDQYAAMEKAVKEMFLEAWHGLCTFHIMQNAVILSLTRHINVARHIELGVKLSLNKKFEDYIEQFDG